MRAERDATLSQSYRRKATAGINHFILSCDQGQLGATHARRDGQQPIDDSRGMGESHC
jgi:hypothetical protein